MILCKYMNGGALQVQAKYQKIKKWLEQNIQNGTWGEHETLPPEVELADQFNASRMTARRAIMELVAENKLERQPGVGTFVSHKKQRLSLLKIKNISDEVIERGSHYSNNVLVLEPILAQSKEALGLELELETPVVKSQILHFENNKPIQLESRYINKDLVPDYIEQHFNSEFTPASFLQKQYPLTKVLFYVEARICTPYEQEKLALNKGDAVLLIWRKTWSKEGLISYTELVHPSHSYQLGGELNFTSEF